MSPTRLFVRRPTLIFVVVALAAMMGTFAWRLLVRQQYPNISLPTVTISIADAGASTTVMRDTIVRPIVVQLGGTPQLQSTGSIIQNGQANISATFNLSSNVDSDLSNVARAYQAAQGNLPPNLIPPTIFATSPSQIAVIHYAVSSQKLSQVDLAQLVNARLVPSLEQVNGVSKVDVVGDVTPAFDIRVDPGKLAADGYTIDDVVATLRANNLRAPGGYAYEPNRQTSIDVAANITSAASIEALPLGKGSSAAAGLGAAPGTPAGSASGAAYGRVGALNSWTVPTSIVRIGDIAAVVKAYKPRITYAYSGGRQVILLDIHKTIATSEVTVANNVQAALPALRAQYPNVRFETVEVEANLTSRALSGAIRTLMEGIILIAIVMLFFLQSWRSAVIIMVAIPTSLAVALFVMHLTHLTLDTISLLAMTLVIGILIDDSTVVLENVQRHHDDLGEEPSEAAVRGRAEISTAAVVLTLVDVVVFLPIALLSGPIGRELSEFGIVVTISTLTSLFMSFTVTPALAGRWGLYSKWKPPRWFAAFSVGVEHVRDWYRSRALPWALRFPWIVVGISAVSFVAAVMLLPLGIVGKAYIPPQDRGEIFVQFFYPPGTPLDATRAGMLDVEHAVDAFADLRAESTTVGGYDAAFGGFVQAPNVGEIHLFLKDGRSHSTNYWVVDLQKLLRREVPRANAIVIPANGTGGGQVEPIDELVGVKGGGDPVHYARLVLKTLKATPGAVDVTSSASELSPNVVVRFDRAKARALDASIGAAAIAVQAAFGGATATQIQTALGVVYVDVIYPVAHRQELASVLNIPLRTATGKMIRVGDIAFLDTVPEPPLITRQNQNDVIHLDANVTGGYSLSNVQRDFNRRLAALHLPSNVIVTPTSNGQQRHMNEVLHAIGTSLVISIMLIFLLMVGLYNSYRSPLVILFAIPVATVGALGALWLTGETLNLFSMIGSILLVGIVTKNGILLVDRANALQKEGLERREAIIESGATRMRPIVMTTVAMIAGLFPLALALDPSSAVRRSLGTVVIGGMSSSLLLTLLLVPVMYNWFAPKLSKPKKAESQRDGKPAHRPMKSGAPAS